MKAWVKQVSERRAFHVEEIVGTKFQGGASLHAGGQASWPVGQRRPLRI